MSVADEVFELFDRGGRFSYSERVSMADHAAQAAALACEHGAEDALIVAALLHDIGNFVGEADSEFGVTNHDALGASWLAGRFASEVTEPVRLHVAAKRYRCFVDPGYVDRLSPASVATMALQGGPMDANEAQAFESEPFAKQALAVRVWDDSAKVAGLKVPSIEDYRHLLDDPSLYRVPAMELMFADRNEVCVSIDGDPSRFHAVWLRDNLIDERSRHVVNNQKFFDVADLPEVVEIAEAEVAEGRLRVTFEPELRVGEWDAGWLATCRYDSSFPRPLPRASERARPWLGSRFEPHRTSFPSVADGGPLFTELTEALWCDGLVILDGLDEIGGTVEHVAGLWGPVLETNYGRTFEVRAREHPINLAYTTSPLGLHTDNPYRQPVPGYQLLRCVVAGEQGGVTVMVDGFKAAEELRDQDSEAFERLTRHRVGFRWVGDGIELESHRPLIQADEYGRIESVHYNNRSVLPLRLTHADMMPFYRAFRKLAKMLRRPELCFRIAMRPGECLVFDNQRILHGRDGETDPNRLLHGCYLARDWVDGCRFED
ncbi:MAG: TauD/TfdA family dioxygenase [Actinomycetota bacterium]|nr:TauD/TfdA family dioxygenase [Actinomycetota bacterium]